MDHLKEEERSWNMRRIKSKNTKPEIIFRKLIHRVGYRYRLHDKKLPGKPDLVLKKFKTAIFIHGCFWHQHEKCLKAATPKSNIDYWGKKLVKNLERDADNIRRLKYGGWHVFIVWECELKNPERIFKRFESFIDAAKDGRSV
ncbi:MAG: very short patch repair endonuclease [Oscillospiraceae bacterium]|nr:very short patch repair endonuclease [Oscillospiraceae bacterium]